MRPHPDYYRDQYCRFMSVCPGAVHDDAEVADTARVAYGMSDRQVMTWWRNAWSEEERQRKNSSGVFGYLPELRSYEKPWPYVQ